VLSAAARRGADPIVEHRTAAWAIAYPRRRPAVIEVLAIDPGGHAGFFSLGAGEDESTRWPRASASRCPSRKAAQNARELIWSGLISAGSSVEVRGGANRRHKPYHRRRAAPRNSFDISIHQRNGGRDEALESRLCGRFARAADLRAWRRHRSVVGSWTLPVEARTLVRWGAHHPRSSGRRRVDPDAPPRLRHCQTIGGRSLAHGLSAWSLEDQTRGRDCADGWLLEATTLIEISCIVNRLQLP
jgi:hypothetical protein